MAECQIQTVNGGRVIAHYVWCSNYNDVTVNTATDNAGLPLFNCENNFHFRTSVIDLHGKVYSTTGLHHSPSIRFSITLVCLFIYRCETSYILRLSLSELSDDKQTKKTNNRH